jgi:chromosome segregation ATPase
MGLFSQNNDDDIDDIYDKLEDIYNRLEALDVVNAFSSRLSRLEKSSAYLENVLLENLKQLEKRTDTLESLCKTYEERINNLGDTLEEVRNQQAQTLEQQQKLQELHQEIVATPSTTTDDSATYHDITFEMDCIKDDIKALRDSIKENQIGAINGEFSEKIKSLESTADQAMIKALHIERLWQMGKLNERDIYDDINALDDKIENLNKLIVDDSKNIKSLAKCIVNHSKYIQDLQDDISKFGIKGKA